MIILGLHHAQITIPLDAADAARRFYCGVLGLTEMPVPKPLQGRAAFWLQVGGVSVHVGREDGVNRQATKGHLAYEVADLKAWRERLAGAGVTVLESIPIPGYTRFEFRDPFGNRVEMIEALG